MGVLITIALGNVLSDVVLIDDFKQINIAKYVYVYMLKFPDIAIGCSGFTKTLKFI